MLDSFLFESMGHIKIVDSNEINSKNRIYDWFGESEFWMRTTGIIK